MFLPATERKKEGQRRDKIRAAIKTYDSTSYRQKKKHVRHTYVQKTVNLNGSLKLMKGLMSWEHVIQISLQAEGTNRESQCKSSIGAAVAFDMGKDICELLHYRLTELHGQITQKYRYLRKQTHRRLRLFLLGKASHIQCSLQLQG